MTQRNRNLIIGLVAAALFLCCCAVVFAGVVGWMTFGPQANRPATGERPVTVITRVATAELPVAPATRPQTSATATPGAGAKLTPQAAATPTPPAAAGGQDFEALLAEAKMPARDQRDLAMRLKSGVGDIPLVVNATPPSYKVGDKAKFWISNEDTKEHKQITAELLYITPHLYMWVEEGIKLNQADLEKSAKRFEEKTYPTNREFFGSEWTPGVDNDIHLSILHARSLGKRVAGYYYSADEYSKSVNQYSNEREMFYVSAESDNGKPNSDFYDGTLAHEFQHMIHWANDRNEDTWVNEGMSELASELNGFDPGGAEFAYAQKPDTQLTTWADPSEGNDAHYGASYLFMAYFLDRFGEDLTKAVVASPENGILGFNDALTKAGRAERFDDIYADWLIANYLDAPKATSDGRFGYEQIDPPQPAVAETIRRFPATGAAQVGQYAADFISLKGRGAVTINFEGQTQVGLVDAQVRGKSSWWSNRGDDSDATLTRAFDLRGVKSATLAFSAWYDVEDGWDYAYVAVSTDGGVKWQLQRGKYTTDKNPEGNAFGPGWTGISGGGRAPQWVQEQVDLTAFAGKQILLRFEYVTDDAVNGPGFMVDDVAIPELSYSDGGENGAGGWDAAGWVLTDNRLAQRWLVQLVEIGSNKITVERLAVGADGRGQLDVADLGKLDKAVLIISGLAPVTTEAAKYSYTIAVR
ncbi:MAG: immune inhibitor A [Chloroflexi bacterium]|nr:immune inhibitor A [Chloroflexota bacterium]